MVLSIKQKLFWCPNKYYDYAKRKTSKSVLQVMLEVGKHFRNFKSLFSACVVTIEFVVKIHKLVILHKTVAKHNCSSNEGTAFCFKFCQICTTP